MNCLTVVCTVFIILLSLCQAAENAQMVRVRRGFSLMVLTFRLRFVKSSTKNCRHWLLKDKKQRRRCWKCSMQSWQGRRHNHWWVVYRSFLITVSIEVEELMEQFTPKIKKELETLRPMKNGKVITMDEIFEMIDKIWDDCFVVFNLHI